MTAAPTILRGSAATTLAIGIVLMEFSAAVNTLAAGALMPVIQDDLGADATLPLLVSSATVGMFAALPFSSRLLQRLRPSRLLVLGTVGLVGGTSTAASAQDVWAFALGRFGAGCAGGIIAVVGISAAVRCLEERSRLRVLSWTSAMWLLPALVGPQVAVGLEHLVGWRWALLAPLPLVVVARLVVVRAAPLDKTGAEQHRPLGPALLVPAGMAGFLFLVVSPWWWVAPVAAGAAILGFRALVPAGTMTCRRGTPSALAALTLFGAGYAGAQSLVTMLLVVGYGADLTRAGIVLSASPACWALAALMAPSLGRRGAPPALGLALCAAAVLALGILAPTGAGWVVALVLWGLAGSGAGLAYPGMYLRATTTGSGLTAAVLATAAILTEDFGALLAASVGAALPAAFDGLGLGRTPGFTAAYIGFGTALCLAAIAATRSVASDPAPRGPERR